jgi:hypothetical protein
MIYLINGVVVKQSAGTASSFYPLYVDINIRDFGAEIKQSAWLAYINEDGNNKFANTGKKSIVWSKLVNKAYILDETSKVIFSTPLFSAKKNLMKKEARGGHTKPYPSKDYFSAGAGTIFEKEGNIEKLTIDNGGRNTRAETFIWNDQIYYKDGGSETPYQISTATTSSFFKNAFYTDFLSNTFIGVTSNVSKREHTFRISSDFHFNSSINSGNKFYEEKVNGKNIDPEIEGEVTGIAPIGNTGLYALTTSGGDIAIYNAEVPINKTVRFCDYRDATGACCDLGPGRYGNAVGGSASHPNGILTHYPCPTNDRISFISVPVSCAVTVWDHYPGYGTSYTLGPGFHQSKSVGKDFPDNTISDANITCSSE